MRALFLWVQLIYFPPAKLLLFSFSAFIDQQKQLPETVSWLMGPKSLIFKTSVLV